MGWEELGTYLEEEIHGVWPLVGFQGEEREDSGLPSGDSFVLEESDGPLTEKGARAWFSLGVCGAHGLWDNIL